MNKCINVQIGFEVAPHYRALTCGSAVLRSLFVYINTNDLKSKNVTTYYANCIESVLKL